jgi:hypothetical protein
MLSRPRNAEITTAIVTAPVIRLIGVSGSINTLSTSTNSLIRIAGATRQEAAYMNEKTNPKIRPNVISKISTIPLPGNLFNNKYIKVNAMMDTILDINVIYHPAVPTCCATTVGAVKKT